MTFLETILQALNSVKFYIVVFEICAQSISQSCYYIHGCLENFNVWVLPPTNSAPTLPIKLILPPLTGTGYFVGETSSSGEVA